MVRLIEGAVGIGMTAGVILLIIAGLIIRRAYHRMNTLRGRAKREFQAARLSPPSV